MILKKRESPLPQGCQTVAPWIHQTTTLTTGSSPLHWRAQVQPLPSKVRHSNETAHAVNGQISSSRHPGQRTRWLNQRSQHNKARLATTNPSQATGIQNPLPLPPGLTRLMTPTGFLEESRLRVMSGQIVLPLKLSWNTSMSSSQTSIWISLCLRKKSQTRRQTQLANHPKRPDLVQHHPLMTVPAHLSHFLVTKQVCSLLHNAICENQAQVSDELNRFVK